jgi:hypothetical protein
MPGVAAGPVPHLRTALDPALLTLGTHTTRVPARAVQAAHPGQAGRGLGGITEETAGRGELRRSGIKP